MPKIGFWGTFVLMSALLLESCNETFEPVPQESDSLFFPLQVGAFRDYEVRQVNFTNIGTIDTLNFLLREEIVDSFPNAENSFTYILHILSRESLEDEWQLDSVWSTRSNPFQAIQVEENIPFVKLVFPIEEGRRWDGNAFNTLSEDDYEYDSIGFARTINSLEFDNTIAVIQNDFADGFVLDDIRTEIFARNIGLIERRRLILNYCTTPECLETPQQEIELGIDYVQRIIGYGFN